MSIGAVSIGAANSPSGSSGKGMITKVRVAGSPVDEIILTPEDSSVSSEAKVNPKGMFPGHFDVTEKLFGRRAGTVQWKELAARSFRVMKQNPGELKKSIAIRIDGPTASAPRPGEVWLYRLEVEVSGTGHFGATDGGIVYSRTLVVHWPR